MSTTKDRLRALLRATPDGLTVPQIMERLNASDDKPIRLALRAMPDTYIDRWVRRGAPYAAVWCVVEVPEDCPRPEPGYRTEEEKELARALKEERAVRKAEAKREEEQRRRELHRLANLNNIRDAWYRNA